MLVLRAKCCDSATAAQRANGAGQVPFDARELAQLTIPGRAIPRCPTRFELLAGVVRRRRTLLELNNPEKLLRAPH
jgi:hypothetical protein